MKGSPGRIRITELLHEVARETSFMAAFTNLRIGENCPNESALLAAILADATNLDLTRMAAASQGVTRDQLVWTQDAYIRDDTYRAALATIINAQHRLPIAAVWGDGTTSSSDGQFFRGGKRGAAGGDINARYGVDPGFSFYTHVSDQHGPYHVKVISAATHEAPYVLDGLLHHGSNLTIAEHFTDTGGATDPSLRRRCQGGLNKSEQRHALTQAIYTFRQGRIIDRSDEAQQYRASGLNLVIAAIVYWNSTYMTEAVTHLRSGGEAVPDDLAHTSPVGWEHIAFSGDFLWDRAAKATGRKPLNLSGKQRAA